MTLRIFLGRCAPSWTSSLGVKRHVRLNGQSRCGEAKFLRHHPMNMQTRIAFPRPTRMTSERPTSRAHRRILAASAVSLLSLFAIPCNASGNTGLIVNSPAYWTGRTDGSWTRNNWASDSAGSIPATSSLSDLMTDEWSGAADGKNEHRLLSKRAFESPQRLVGAVSTAQ